MVVPELSLETIESGRGMNCMSSENPTRARLEGFICVLLSEFVCFVSLSDIWSIPGNGE